MLESMFQMVFGYRRVLFEQGEFRLSPSVGSYLAALVVLAIVGATILIYRRASLRGRLRDRIVLASLRLATLGLLLLCLFRPVLAVKAAIPQRNLLAVVLDDSRSMQIPDVNGAPRGAFVQREFGESALMKGLSERFGLRVFRFSSAADRLASANGLTFTGQQTRLGAALDGVRQEMSGLPVAGMVVVSDGADTSETPLEEALLALKAEGLPVFTVGVGSERLERDIEISRVTVPKTALKGGSMLVDIAITQRGYSGKTVTVDVEDDGRIVGSQQVQLPEDGSQIAVRTRALASESGPRTLQVRVTRQPDEIVAQNNARQAHVEVRDGPQKILYFEGEPRFELKFIKRAVADDANLHVVALQRTADKKFYRIDVDKPEELVNGFPTSRDELFAYRGLILGSVEAGAFSGDQLRMIAEFVDKRGGGLLMLGGPRAFGEGGYGGTPVADALPVTFGRNQTPPDQLAVTRVKVSPTREANGHAITQIAGDERASAKRWPELPELTTINDLGDVKAGATVLLSGLDERRRSHVVMAQERYGRGKAIVLATQDTWRWQMHASISVEDQTHETFWRQLMRWLIDGVPETVEVRAPERVTPGDAIVLSAEVVDPAFVEVNDAAVVAHVTAPDGTTSDVPLAWGGDRPGEYRGTLSAARAGAYEVTVEATRGEQALGRSTVHVQAAPSDDEYVNAALNPERLRRIADETGGRFYTADTLGRLPEDIRYSGRGVVSVEERELWNMPLMLFLLVGLVCLEWRYRRAVGLG